MSDEQNERRDAIQQRRELEAGERAMKAKVLCNALLNYFKDKDSSAFDISWVQEILDQVELGEGVSILQIHGLDRTCKLHKITL